MFALDQQLDDMLAEGIENRFARHQAMRDRTIAWARGHGFKLFSAAGYESPTVTCIDNSLNIDVAALNQHLRRNNMIISNGYGSLKGKNFRIAHMGDIQPEDLDVLFQAIDSFLEAAN
jgi:aspartate aminotransferase-like enzyme